MMNLQEIIAELRLFKAFTLNDELDSMKNTKLSSLDKGIIYTRDIPDSIKEEAEKMYGLKPEEWNNTFHKSFQTVLDTPIETLIAQQIIHYFTTYGMEAINLYNSDLVYVPHENLEIPELENDIELKVIRNISEQELQDKLMTLLTSGIALSRQTISDIMTLSDYLDKDNFDEIKNKEIRIALYDKYNIVPKNNMEFLRYVVYKTTNSTLYIQSNDMIYSIKKSDKYEPYNYFKNYVSKNKGYEELAKIFLRNKNMFLAFKTSTPNHKYEKELNTIINKISKYAPKYHQPLKPNILDNLSSIKSLKDLESNRSSIINELDKITIFREIRIINGLKYRISASKAGNNGDSIVYRVRNGKAYATKFNQLEGVRQLAAMKSLVNLIYNHLIARLSEKFENKTVCIPDNVTYMAPSSEKQFVGNMPEGSSVSISRNSNMVVGVHWNNLSAHRVDLDLKLMNKNEHFGWNASYYSGSGDIVFSGDLTDAPLPYGATEVFLVTQSVNNRAFLLTLNDFTQCKEEIPFELFVAKFPDDTVDKHYIVDPNKVELLLHNKFENIDKQKVTPTLTLGYVEITKNSIDISFKNFETIKGRVNKPDEVNKMVYDYTNLYNKTQLSLNELLADSGAIITRDKNIETMEEVVVDNETLYKKIVTPVDYDLSYDNITKETFISLLGEIK